jgi:hypothetical protein
VFAITNYENHDFQRDIGTLGILPEKYLIKAHHTPNELVEMMSSYLAKGNKSKPMLS